MSKARLPSLFPSPLVGEGREGGSCVDTPALTDGPPSPALPRKGGESRSVAALSLLRNANRFIDARLQAVSSRNMYSEHGFDARIAPDAAQVCQSLIVVWYCRPGSAENHAAAPIFSHSSRAFTVLATPRLPVRQFRSHSASDSTAFRNSSVTRTELLEFWPETVR